ncbi:glutaminyl-peptide cyclotransferase [Terrimonas pollutisoli]|uniref:glutaminyl-peptide cyclotransferase n=1 Tax=Terrimonas pollutisoli TaxID=3034147 RepID=UPI0023EC4858|nr:glutaminyl-peptide cyclotransferase [Terrimonas sp. H1YJ31]
MKILSGIAILLVFISCNNADSEDNKEGSIIETPAINYVVKKTHPHDTTSFTEGLLFHKGQLYESTGSPDDLPGTRSLFGVLSLETGLISKKVELDRKKYFGEGIVFFNDKVYQLTYKNKIGFIYDATTFRKLSEFTIPSQEGWGMTTDGHRLIMSDGTSQLTYLDPETLQVRKTITVSDARGSVPYLNELEFIKGFIYANVYTTNELIKIDPGNGQVVAKLDLSSLANEVKSLYPGSLKMNGIAYDSLNNKTYITGKMWPKIYEISFAY